MHFRLDHLERELPETTLLEAERLLDAGSPPSLSELEPRLWAAAWTVEGNRLEVEVKLGRSAITAASCDCPIFAREGVCPHIAATALLIRRQLQEALPKEKKRDKPTSQARKLTTALVLKEVDPEELVDFVRDYARRNRDFAIALKARFTADVDAIAGKAKYHQLLDSALNLARRQDRSLGVRGTDRLATVLEELFQQSEQAMAQSNLLDASALLQAIVEKIGPVVGKTPPDDDRIREAVGEAIDRLVHLQGSAPPDLLKTLRAFAGQQHQRALFRRHGLDLRFWPLLAGPFPDEAERERLHGLFTAQKQRYEEEGRPVSSLLIAFYQLLRSLDAQSEALSFVVGHLYDRKLLSHALTRACRENDEASARWIIQAALMQLEEDDEEREALTELLIPLSEQLGEYPAIVPLLREAILHSMAPKLIEPLQRASGSSWPRVAEKLIIALRQKAQPEAKKLVARLYQARDDSAALLDFLEEEGTLELLMAFDRSLWAAHRTRVVAIYRRLLAIYAGEHLGPKSSAKIRKVLEHLKALGETRLSRELAERFRNSYPERHTLMEQLAHFS